MSNTTNISIMLLVVLVCIGSIGLLPTVRRFMEVKAESKNVRMSPRKVSLIAEVLRKKTVPDALAVLAVIRQRAAGVLKKTLKSAIANAVHNAKLKENTLVIKKIEVTQAQSLKRFHPSTRGRVHPYKKRGSHIRIVLEEAHGTKS